MGPKNRPNLAVRFTHSMVRELEFPFRALESDACARKDFSDLSYGFLLLGGNGDGQDAQSYIPVPLSEPPEQYLQPQKPAPNEDSGVVGDVILSSLISAGNDGQFHPLVSREGTSGSINFRPTDKLKVLYKKLLAQSSRSFPVKVGSLSIFCSNMIGVLAPDAEVAEQIRKVLHDIFGVCSENVEPETPGCTRGGRWSFSQTIPLFKKKTTTSHLRIEGVLLWFSTDIYPTVIICDNDKGKRWSHNWYRTLPEWVRS